MKRKIRSEKIQEISGGCQTDADHGELLRAVVRAVVHINRLGDAALVEGGLEAVDEVGGFVSRVEGAVGHDA